MTSYTTKRAQISSQVFVFVLITLVVSLTLIFGVRIIRTLKRGGDEAAFAQFQKNLKHTLEDIDSNEEITIPINFPSGVYKVCFCGRSEPVTGLPQCSIHGLRRDIKTSLQQEKQVNDNNTIFLVFYDGSVKPIEVDNLYSNFICLNSSSRVKIEGTGKYVVVTQVN